MVDTWGKFLELLVYHRLVHLLGASLSKFQSGGRANHGAISQLIRVTEAVWTEMRGGKRQKPNFVVQALLDAAKAFDRMHRMVLLDKLWERGVRGRLFEFICAYFYNRRRQVRVGDEMSEEVRPTAGGPQGSVLIMFC